MNIRDALLEVHSKAQAEKIVGYVGSDPERFAELMKLMMGHVYRITQRAAWPVSYCVERHPDLITPYWNEIIHQLKRDDAHVAVRRNVARLLQFVDIPQRYRAPIFDACSELLADPKQPVAVRCFSMTVAANIAGDSPELLNEIKLSIANYPHLMTPGMRSRVKRIFGT